MTHIPSEKDLDTILEGLAMEECCDGATLSEYLGRYPEYSQEITEFVHELTRPTISEHLPLSKDDQAELEHQFTKFLKNLGEPSKSILDELSVEDIKKLAIKLSIKRQVITALRRGVVIVDTISQSFLSSLIEALGCDSEELKQELGMSSRALDSLSYKSDNKPEAVNPISFEETLKNAGYSEDELAQFMD